MCDTLKYDETVQAYAATLSPDDWTAALRGVLVVAGMNADEDPVNDPAIGTKVTLRDLTQWMSMLAVGHDWCPLPVRPALDSATLPPQVRKARVAT